MATANVRRYRLLCNMLDCIDSLADDETAYNWATEEADKVWQAMTVEERDQVEKPYSAIVDDLHAALSDPENTNWLFLAEEALAALQLCHSTSEKYREALCEIDEILGYSDNPSYTVTILNVRKLKEQLDAKGA